MPAAGPDTLPAPPVPGDDHPGEPGGGPGAAPGPGRLAGLVGRPRAEWLMAVPVLELAGGAWRHRWVTEDAYITFHAVEMTVAGHPMVMNVDERVEAATSLLWLAVLVGLRVTLAWAVDLAWLAVVVGLALTLVGLVAGTAAGAAVAGRLRPGAPRWPAGALVLAVLPPMWDFATSGLETGLVFAWLGVSHWLLVRRWVAVGDAPAARRPPPASPWWLVAVLGLGPLIRPDLGLFSAVLLAVHLACVSRPGWRGRVRALAVAAAAPAVYELFRMAYFASLVPSPALAKEAGEAAWHQGLLYLDNLAGPYLLAVPAAALVAWAAVAVPRARRPGGGARTGGVDRRGALVVAAPALAGVVHGLYIVRVGGDFMHGRLLLPALFALCLPVAVLPAAAPGRRWTAAAPVLVGAWALVCATRLRLPPPGAAPERWAAIVDERIFWRTSSGRAHPVTLEDYATVPGVARGAHARELAGAGADAWVPFAGPPDVPLAPGEGVVFEDRLLGLGSTAAGVDVRVRDEWGLADAVGGHIEIDRGGRIGHQKPLPEPYREAMLPRRVDERVPVYDVDPAEVAAARRVLACPAARELLDATREPLTPGRLVRNVLRAPALTRLRLPRLPSRLGSCDELG